MANDQWVLEWSKKTKNFHAQPLSFALASAQKSMINNDGNDYKIIMVGTKDVCEEMADNHRHRLVAA